MIFQCQWSGCGNKIPNNRSSIYCLRHACNKKNCPQSLFCPRHDATNLNRRFAQVAAYSNILASHWEIPELILENIDRYLFETNVPMDDQSSPTEYDSFLFSELPELWMRKHQRPIFLPGELKGCKGPTSYEEDENWKKWKKEIFEN